MNHYLKNNTSYIIKWISLFVLTFLSLSSKAISETKTYKILYLNSYNIGYAWSDSITKGVKKALTNPQTKLYIECLDAKRFGQEKFDVFTDYLVKKYENITFDAIVTSDNDALEYILKYGPQLYPDIPVVFCGISNPEDYNFEGKKIYGFTESTDPAKTVSVLTKLLPQASSLLFVTDNTTSGTVIIKDYQRLQKLYPSVKINFVSDVDVDELIKTVKKGDKGDMVYLLRINRDKYGNMVDYLDFFRRIAEVSSKPVFADDEAIMGHGVVGGNANRGFTQGYQSGKMALELVKNKITPPHINKVQDEYIFDFRQLKHFKIKPSLLPKNSVVINKPMVQYLKYIKILVIAIVILTGIIIILTVINRKRLLAERKVSEQLAIINDRNLLLEQSYTQLSELNCELEEANQQLSNMNISLEEAKEKAEESEKLKSSFLANLSHEIRTPLNAILGFSALLLEPKMKESDKGKYFNIIQSNSDSLLVLIDDILDFSKIEAGQVQIFKEQVLVNEVFEELFTFFEQKINKDVKLHISEFARNNTISIDTDKIRFKQILTNLLTNAIKFTEQGTITLGFELLNAKHIRFYVKDTGIGIEKKYHQIVFERFRKVEDANTKLYSGSGLGLAICKKLTELLEGQIWVDGEPGKGSTFSFTLPNYTLVKSYSTETLTVPKENMKYNWKGCTIAVAEDEDNNYLLLEHVITKYGATIIRFKDGHSIVNYFKQLTFNNVHLILMDIKMKEMDGYHAMELIHKVFPGIPVIAQTAFAMNEDKAAIRKKGFADYISKPINIQLLQETINKYLCPPVMNE